MTAVIIALYGGGVKLCRVELPGFLYDYNTYWTIEEKSYEEYGLMGYS